MVWDKSERMCLCRGACKCKLSDFNNIRPTKIQSIVSEKLQGGGASTETVFHSCRKICDMSNPDRPFLMCALVKEVKVITIITLIFYGAVPTTM